MAYNNDIERALKLHQQPKQTKKEREAEMAELMKMYNFPKSKKKNEIKLTESELRNIVSESVKRVLREDFREAEKKTKYNTLLWKIQYAYFDDNIYDDAWVENIINNTAFDEESYNTLQKAIFDRKQEIDNEKQWIKNGEDAVAMYDWLTGWNSEYDKYGKEKERQRMVNKYDDYFTPQGERRTPEDMERYSNNRMSLAGAKKIADKRPLHRKGSVNNDLMHMKK